MLRRYHHGADLINMAAPSSLFYFHHDELGSVINVTSSTGVKQWTYTYEPYGMIKTETKNKNTAPATVLKYAGEQLDPTGLYHLRARQYDPATGRFRQHIRAVSASGAARPSARGQSGRSVNAAQWGGRTAAKCRRSRVITRSVSSRAASATTEASVPPSGNDAYSSTSPPINRQSPGAGASTSKAPRPRRNAASTFAPRRRPTM